VVEQEWILAGWWWERALGESKDDDPAEAEMAKGVHVEDAYATQTERTLVAYVEVTGFERTNLCTDGVEEAV
jgi:hypothetical protein